MTRQGRRRWVGRVGNSGLSSLGVPGVPWHTQILSDQLTLFQPWGTDYAHLFTTGTPGFLDLPTALNIQELDNNFQHFTYHGQIEFPHNLSINHGRTHLPTTSWKGCGIWLFYILGIRDP